VAEVGGTAHSQRECQAMWSQHGGQVDEQALKFFGQLYDVEREVANARSQTEPDAQRRSRPVGDALHLWLRQQGRKITDGSATTRAIDRSDPAACQAIPPSSIFLLNRQVLN
jgi:hypothetical protein